MEKNVNCEKFKKFLRNFNFKLSASNIFFKAIRNGLKSFKERNFYLDYRKSLKINFDIQCEHY